MSDSTYDRLLRQIKKGTKEGRIAWAPGSFVDSYQAPLGKGSVIVTIPNLNDSYGIREDVPIATLQFLNERGEIFNTIACCYESDSEYKSLKEIFDNARNSYMQIDETLKSMFDDLESRGCDSLV